MVFTDWTCGGTAGAECVLDASIKYAGNSSFRGKASSTIQTTLTHNTFSETQMQVILWKYQGDASVDGYVGHSSYGDLKCVNSVATTWERFKVSFWYDSTTNIKWGRVERWDGAAWVQIGTDTNFGAGVAAAGSLKLMSAGYATAFYSYFDELEVYS